MYLSYTYISVYGTWLWSLSTSTVYDEIAWTGLVWLIPAAILWAPQLRNINACRWVDFYPKIATFFSLSRLTTRSAAICERRVEIRRIVCLASDTMTFPCPTMKMNGLFSVSMFATRCLAKFPKCHNRFNYVFH